MILPADTFVEKLILAAAMLNLDFWEMHAAKLLTDDFSLESHRRIWSACLGLRAQEKTTDRVSVATALTANRQIESVGGLSYLISLDEGMPEISNVGGYIDTIIGHANRRRVMHEATAIYNRAQDLSIPADELVATAEHAFSDISRRASAAKEYESIREFTDGYEPGFEHLMSPDNFPEHRGIATPLAGLNNLIGGFRAGDLILVAARPSMGKSALCLQFANYAAVKLKKRTAIISLEMQKPAQFRRMVAQISRVNITDMRLGNMTPSERVKALDAALKLTEAPLYFDACHQNTHSAITACAIRQHSRNGLDLLIADHLHLMIGPEKEARHMLGGITKALKGLAMKLKIPIVLAAQLSRKCEDRSDKRPMLSDLRESGSIEEDSDLVLFVYRAEKYSPDREDLRGVAELILEKQREGPTGKVAAMWLPEYQTFIDSTRDFNDEQI